MNRKLLNAYISKQLKYSIWNIEYSVINFDLILISKLLIIFYKVNFK